MFQGQRSNLKCQKLRNTSSVIVTDISIKPQQFPTSSFWVAHYHFCAAVTLTLDPSMTLKLNRDLDILKLYIHTENEVARYSHSKGIAWMKKYENSSQGQRSRSNVINFQPLLAFTTGHIPTKLHRLPTSSFRDFLRTDRRTNWLTDAAKNIPARSVWRADNDEWWNAPWYTSYTRVLWNVPNSFQWSFNPVCLSNHAEPNDPMIMQ